MKHGHGSERIDKNTSYEGQFFKDMREGKGRTTSFQGAQSTSTHELSNMGQCIHEGSYAHNVKCGVGSESYPDGSSFHGVWFNGLKHGPGLLKIANDATYHAIFNEDTIIDIFFSVEHEEKCSFSSSNNRTDADGLRNAPQVLPEATTQDDALTDQSLSVAGSIDTRRSVVCQKSSANVRFDPFERGSSLNADSIPSKKPLKHIIEPAHVNTSHQSLAFSDFAAEHRSDVYVVDEADLPDSQVANSLSSAQIHPSPAKVTVLVDYGIWGEPGIHQQAHFSPAVAHQSNSPDSDANFDSQSASQLFPAPAAQVHLRRSHATRHLSMSSKQHRVPGLTSKESVASSRSKGTKKIDIFNL
jgi:hypothetical protein